MILLALPALSAAQIMLLIDRYLGGHFFDTQAGGSAVIWQHFFWIFGHPEVYILIIPAFACVSEIVPVFSRKPIFGYPVMVGATVMIGLISTSVWAHHMFSVGMTSVGNIFFAISTFTVAVPTGIKIFNWLGTMYGGRIRFDLPMLFCIAFLFQFLIAGLTGMMLGVAPLNWQLTDSYFVVAHFHYTLVGGFLFGMFAGFYYWYPKAVGRLLDRRLGLWHFWLFVIGFHLTFDTMHFPGLLGMPRRIFTYDTGRGWDTLNSSPRLERSFKRPAFSVSSSTSFARLRKANRPAMIHGTHGRSNGPRASPPPEYNFATTPAVRSRRPLWDLKHPEDPDWKYE